MKQEPLIFFHLKLVAKISLALGAIAMVALVIALTMVTDQSGDTYSAIVQVQHLKSENLGKVMLLAGLLLVTITGLVTWLIALYSSFRIAGPLYRFSQNLRLAATDESAPLIDLRAGDSLRTESEMIKQTVGAVRAHHAEAASAMGQAREAIASGDEVAYARSVAHLRMLDEKVRF